MVWYGIVIINLILSLMAKLICDLSNNRQHYGAYKRAH